MKLKLTKMEKAWILYDVGNSAFNSACFHDPPHLF